jgi:Tol biopolymer transport system component
MTPSWSGDKRWVYFTSARSGSNQIWKVRVQDGQEVQLTTKRGGWAPLESSDERWVYYMGSAPPNAAIYKVSVEGGEESRVFELPPAAQGAFSWTVVERGIYFVDSAAASGLSVKFFDFASKQKTAIAQLEKGPAERLFGLAVSPDEQWILYAVQSSSNDIRLVENFH